MTEHAIAILGASESGKSTWIGALAGALLRGEADHLELVDVAAVMEPLLQLTEPLDEGRYPKRTPLDQQTDLELALRTQGQVLPETAFDLRVGDYAGEQVERLFRDRARGWSGAWKARANADAIVLFLRPEAIRPLPCLEPSPALRDRWQALRQKPQHSGSVRVKPLLPAGPDDVFDQALLNEEHTAPPRQPGDPVHVPTVLALVELLQFLRNVRGLAPGQRPPRGSLRVVLLVSAWDQVDDAWRVDGKGPPALLAEQASLLDDFLWSNFHRDDVFRFGLSSTGGDLRRQADRERYEENPRGFVEWLDVTGKLVHSDDLALPLYWALFGDLALSVG